MSAPDSQDRHEAISRLVKRFGDRVTTNDGIRNQHSNSLTWHAAEPPDVVVFAQDTGEVAEVVAIAAKYRMPIIPFGAGTSLEGHVNAPWGGISLDLSGMDAILCVNPGDLDCTVEAGVTRGALNSHLRDTGLFFSVDPGTQEATIGGMAATRASGTTAVRYGTMRDNVISLQAVMADGTVIDTASRAGKSAAGYDLTRLLVGSEGTLGIITQATVRLHGRPEAVIAAVAGFQSLDQACQVTMQAIAMGLGLARIELLDPLTLRAVNAHAGLSLPEIPTLFLEFHGTGNAVLEQSAAFEELARSEGAVSFESAGDEQDRRRLWKARHDGLWAIREAWPGRTVLVTDVCVPVSRLAECIAETQADIAAAGLTAPIVGHVGDGNFHALPLHDPANEAERQKILAFSDRLAERAIRMEGTCTGEHGVGQGKIGSLRKEMGAAVDVMASIKSALDPLGILNPEKIFRLS
ncbi:MAG: FAD-binding protein [Alphaproteobacteria bacterium]|nr:FAD-binding protein [Alphaproteobacteria bacterium]